MDIRACENEDVNKEYATDKARFCYDGLNKKRITEPMIRDPSGNLVPYGWDEVLQSKIFKIIFYLSITKAPYLNSLLRKIDFELVPRS